MSGGERQYVVDRLRGFALLGILLVNTPFLVISLNGLDDASMPTLSDRCAGFVVVALFQAKSYVVFSFLFGYGLAIMLERVEARGGSGTAAYLRRQLGLLVFGVAHAILLFPGDILVMYAIFGLFLIPLRRRSDRTLLTAAAACLLLQILLLVAVAADPAADDGGLAAAFDHSMTSDSFLGTVVSRATAWPSALGLVGFLQGFLVVGLFFVGLVCGRRGLLADPSQHLWAWRRVRRLGFGIGLPVQLLAGLLFVWPGSDDHPGRLGLSLLLNYATAPILSAGYIAAIALLPRRGLTRTVEADGRMSLTIYLAESLLMTTVSNGWGLGLFGLDAFAALVLALATWLALLAFASHWSRRFVTGPAEALLRAITYWRPPRLEPAA